MVKKTLIPQLASKIGGSATLVALGLLMGCEAPTMMGKAASAFSKESGTGQTSSTFSAPVPTPSASADASPVLVDDGSINYCETGPGGGAPWLAVIRQNGSFVCTGAIVDGSTVIAAANCLTTLTPSQVTVEVGTEVLTAGASTHSQMFSVTSLATHENYDTMTYDWNVGLLSLTTPISWNEHVCAIRVPTTAQSANFPASQDFAVASFGRLPGEGGLSNSLRVFTGWSLPNSEFDKIYGPGAVSETIIALQFPDLNYGFNTGDIAVGYFSDGIAAYTPVAMGTMVSIPSVVRSDAQMVTGFGLMSDWLSTHIASPMVPTDQIQNPVLQVAPI